MSPPSLGILSEFPSFDDIQCLFTEFESITVEWMSPSLSTGGRSETREEGELSSPADATPPRTRGSSLGPFGKDALPMSSSPLAILGDCSFVEEGVGSSQRSSSASSSQLIPFLPEAAAVF